ncbi:hypothetical protein NDU88_001845 [Pleurodeles waltl]|uniref:Uncharacterized protein n=1 Tax=Pleurodeles waltl TaxID=8319 RepID=A0AAV7M0G6_PLEWA|nr:hypothetical protein NDU88_001845 [Pleurodeles waltl]
MQCAYGEFQERQKQQLEEEYDNDSCRAPVAMKQLQRAVRKMNKMCTESGERILAIEDSAMVLERDGGAVKGQKEAHESLLVDEI